MAIYSLNLGFISRSAGRSAVGFSAYISGGRLEDQRTGVTHDYGCKNDVIMSRILAPDDAPEWAKNSSSLWNRVEQFEDEWGTSRFRGDPRDASKNQKSLEAREQFLSSTQTAQTIMGAIPIELSALEAEACVEEFLNDRFVSRGLVVEYALHWDRGNPHFHGQITRRVLVEDNFSQKKDQDIVSKDELMITRKQWEVVVNKHLELGGHEVRIDCRSHEDRGSLLLPTAHEGWYAQQLAERGEYSRIVSDNAAIRQRNIEILCKNPAVLIQEVALKRTTFTRRHLEEEIVRRVGGDEKLFSLLKARVEELDIDPELILNCANQNVSQRDEVFEGGELRDLAGKLTDRLLKNPDMAFAVGENLNRDQIFTSSVYKQQEEHVISCADTLHQRSTKMVFEDRIGRAIAYGEAELGKPFSSEQREAVRHLCSGPDMRILNGKAGTGKTTLLKAVAHAYQEAGYQVMGTSFQGKAVDIMEQEVGIPCKTMDSFLHAWNKHQTQKDLVESGKLWGRPYLYAFNKMKRLEAHRFNANNVILVDEANMIGGRLWEPFLEEAANCGAKVLVIQDPAQIKSREAGDYGRFFAERFGYCETSEVVRQRIPWQRECSKFLNDHNVLDGLKPYHDKGHFKWFEGTTQVHRALAQDYIKDFIENPTQSRMAFAYKNTEVYALNQSIRQALLEKGVLGRQEFSIHGESYTIGDRIRFTQNDNHGQYVRNVKEASFLDRLNPWKDQEQKGENTPDVSKSIKKGVKNGSFGTIESFDEKSSLLSIRLEDNRRVQFNTEEYAHITHGYAMGIHKSEGSTFDRSFVVLDPLVDPTTALVTMTRHREDVSVYVTRDKFIDFKAVVDKLSPLSPKETLQDYVVSEDQKPYFTRVQNYRDLLSEGMTLREEIDGAMEEQKGKKEPFYEQPAYLAYLSCMEEKKRIAEDILSDWQNHVPYTRLSGLRKDVLEVETGRRPRLLSDLEYRASIQVQGYMDQVKETRNLWKTISQSHPGALAPSHSLYEDYANLKADRDSLASVFQENPKLYTPFLRTTEDKEGNLRDYWGEIVHQGDRAYISALKSHAEGHRRSQLQNLYYERLSPDQKAHYDAVQDYVTARNQAAAIYSHLQTKAEESVQVTSNESVLSLEKFHTLQAQRDALALKLIDSFEAYQGFFDVLNIKEDKLLEHAVVGEVREKVQTYKIETDPETRESQAQELKRILTTAKDFRIFKESGLDANRLTFDIAFYDKVKSGEISADLKPEDIYKPIQDYLKSSKESFLLWKMIQVKTETENPNPEATADPNLDLRKQDWQRALTAQNENAHALVINSASLAVISGMRHGIERYIHRQAGIIQREAPKQTSSTPLPHAQKHHQKSPDSFISLEQVRTAARGNLACLAPDLLGPPNKHMSNKTTLRFGTKGSLVVNLAGPKAGQWKDFESGEGGDIINLVQREKNVSLKEAATYLADILNVRSHNAPSLNKISLQPPPQPVAQTSLEQLKENAMRLNAIVELHLKSKPIEGTLAETYLQKERHISGSLAPDLRYIPKGIEFRYQGECRTLQHDCLAAFGRSQDGRLSSVQLTKLDNQGRHAVTHEGAKLNKIHYGIAKGSFVLLQEDKSNAHVFVAEGVETALSLKEAGIKGTIVASMGIYNMANYQGTQSPFNGNPFKGTIIICADNDDHKPNSQTYKTIESTKNHFESQGKAVSIIKPNAPGDDFNDVLKKNGSIGVQEYVKPYLDPDKQHIQDLQRPNELSAGRESKLLESKTPLNREASSSLAPLSPPLSVPPTKPEPKPIEIVSDHVESLLRRTKDFEGFSLGEEAKQELKTYLQLLQRNEITLPALKAHNPELAQEYHDFMQRNMRHKNREMER